MARKFGDLKPGEVVNGVKIVHVQRKDDQVTVFWDGGSESGPEWAVVKDV